ncbi:MAG: hypothetical protein ABIL58_03560 [Pseudomonadota bacterium]
MTNERNAIMDHGGRRLGIDRRQIALPHPGVDRRSGDERRADGDRRAAWSFSAGSDERRETFHLK